MLIVSASLANDLDCSVYAGQNNDTKQLPYAVCDAQLMEEFIYQTGIFKVQLVIQTEEKAIDTDKTSSMAETVFEAMCNTDTIDKLVTYSTSSIFLHNIAIKDLRKQSNTDDKSWTQEMSLEVIGQLL